MTRFKLFDSEEEAQQRLPLGKTLVVRAPNQQKICLVHAPSGFFALQNQCTHAGAELHGGFVNEQDEIVCPLHHYCFDLKTGNPTRASRSKPLKIYTLEWITHENGQALYVYL